jgi:hypothetical protein
LLGSHVGKLTDDGRRRRLVRRADICPSARS